MASVRCSSETCRGRSRHASRQRSAISSDHPSKCSSMRPARIVRRRCQRGIGRERRDDLDLAGAGRAPPRARLPTALRRASAAPGGDRRDGARRRRGARAWSGCGWRGPFRRPRAAPVRARASAGSRRARARRAARCAACVTAPCRSAAASRGAYRLRALPAATRRYRAARRWSPAPWKWHARSAAASCSRPANTRSIASPARAWAVRARLRRRVWSSTIS